MKGKLVRSIVAVAVAGLTAWAPAAPAYGQGQAPAPSQAPAQAPPSAPAQPAPPFTIPAGRDYTIPQRPWRNVLLPYAPFHVDEPNLTNSQRIQQLIQNGKMQLSLNDAVELALENNLDISVQRYWPWIAETDILRTRGGGAQRGVAFVSTSTAFTNQLAISFDPTVTTLLSIDNKTAPVNNPLTAGTGTASAVGNPALQTSTGLANFLYSQYFHTGTNMSIAVNNTRASTSSTAVRFDPDVQSVMSLTLSQQLLNGFGRLPNERYLRVALITKDATDQAFLQTLITDLVAVENDYWELVFARGNVSVQQQAVAEAQQLYDDNQKQVEIGTLAPIEIVRAEAQLATAQQGLINAQTAQLQEQTLLMSVITKNPTAPELRNVEIVPTEITRSPAPMEDTPLNDLIGEALTKRPDILQPRLNLKADDINVHATRNALLPQLTLSAFASGTGLGGNMNTTTSATVAGSQIVDVNGNPVTVLPTPLGPAIPIFSASTHTTVTGVTTGGFGEALSQIFHGTDPEFTFQLAMTLPIRNRVAEADNARSLLAQRQDQMRLQAAINNVDVDVQNAQIVLRQDRASLIAAQKTRVLQEQTLDAEQKKFQLGASTVFLVVTDQQALAVAAAAEVRAQVNLEEAKVNFERAMGRTLEVNNVTLANGKSGVVPHNTLIPGTSVTGALIITEPADGATGLAK